MESEIDTSPSSLPGVAPSAPAAPAAPTLSFDQVKNIELPAKKQEYSAAANAYYAALDAAKASGRTVIVKDGQVVEMKPSVSKTRLADGSFVNDTVPVPDSNLTALYNKMNSAKSAVDRMEGDLKDGIYGVAATVGKNLEASKTDEAEREFDDFVKRVKTIYNLQDSEQSYGMDAQQANIEGAAAQRKGLVAPGARTIWNETRPSPLYSMMVQDSTPDSAPLPDYRPAGTGLPGAGDFATSVPDYNPGKYSGIIGGYANGTLNPEEGIDPEIAWMIKMPDIPFDPHAPAVPVPKSWMQRGANRAQ